MGYIITAAIISLAIFIHELGHFAAARIAKIPVAALSLGFGPALLKKSHRGVEYRLSAIPFGGYLLPKAADPEDFFKISPARRIILSIGGPTANILTALPLFAALNISQGGVSPFAILVNPLIQAAALLSKMTASLAGAFSHQESLTGIVGIVSAGTQFTATWTAAASFAAIISLNLALFNLLPVQALDGEKVLLSLLEYITPKSRALHVPLSMAGWVLIVLLMVYVTVLDVGRIAA